jgi:hypothetical protein
MNGSCHCGAVTIRVPGPPAYLNACNCTLCWKLGAMWGYYPIGEVAFSGAVRSYLRSDIPDARMTTEHCDRCGATTNWRLIGENAPPRLGVNMRLFEPAELAGVELRFGDRRKHATIEPRHYYRDPTIFDGAGAKA